jgi:putative phosphoribosyl transferase
MLEHQILTRYRDRFDAGAVLAERLESYGLRADVVVLALPRGGVPVAFPVAESLRSPLDVFIVRKLGMPGHEELAVGAIASGGVCVLNEQLAHRFGGMQHLLGATLAREQQELVRQETLFRGDAPPLEITDRTVILVDDGLATGSTMRAAVQALRQRDPGKLIVAVPVGAPDTCDELSSTVDELLCPLMPEHFHAVSEFYADFRQTTDEEVCELLRRANERGGEP